MFSAIFKTFVAASFVAAVSAVALPGLPFTNANHLCHCEEFDKAGVPLEWAESKKDGGKFHFNCHYGVGPDWETECGYDPLGLLHLEYVGTDCPAKVAHLLC